LIHIYIKNTIMKKVVRLTESDLRRVVKQIINENLQIRVGNKIFSGNIKSIKSVKK